MIENKGTNDVKWSMVQAALIICGLFICNFAYMQFGNSLFSWTFPLIYSHPWSFYIQIHYMWAYFWSPYLSHITKSSCIEKNISKEQCYNVYWLLAKLISHLSWRHIVFEIELSIFEQVTRLCRLPFVREKVRESLRFFLLFVPSGRITVGKRNLIQKIAWFG